MSEDRHETDPEFFAEVDEFIASMPEDTERIERIASGLPENFHEVLVARSTVAKPTVVAMSGGGALR